MQATSDLANVRAMKVGSQAGKRTLTVLYLIPTDEQHADGFPVVATPGGVTVELTRILTPGRINYKAEKYSFTLKPFIYQEGATGYELQLTTSGAEINRLTPASPEDVSRRQNSLLLPTIFSSLLTGSVLWHFSDD